MNHHVYLRKISTRKSIDDVSNKNDLLTRKKRTNRFKRPRETNRVANQMHDEVVAHQNYLSVSEFLDGRSTGLHIKLGCDLGGQFAIRVASKDVQRADVGRFDKQTQLLGVMVVVDRTELRRRQHRRGKHSFARGVTVVTKMAMHISTKPSVRDTSTTFEYLD
jgi:hypothetical protein